MHWEGGCRIKAPHTGCFAGEVLQDMELLCTAFATHKCATATCTAAAPANEQSTAAAAKAETPI